MRSRIAAALVLLVGGASCLALALGPAVSYARSRHAHPRCAPSRSETLVRHGSSVLFAQETEPGGGEYVSGQTVFGCLRVAQRPVRVVAFPEGVVLGAIRASFDGHYAALYLSSAEQACGKYDPGPQCETSLLESVDLLTGHRRVNVPGAGERGSGTPAALVVTVKGSIAWVSQPATEAPAPLLARDSTGTRTLDPGPIEAGSLTVAGSVVRWRDAGVAHSATLG